SALGFGQVVGHPTEGIGPAVGVNFYELYSVRRSAEGVATTEPWQDSPRNRAGDARTQMLDEVSSVQLHTSSLTKTARINPVYFTPNCEVDVIIQIAPPTPRLTLVSFCRSQG